MVVDLDLEVSDEDQKFMESSAPDSVDKLLDDFIGDKNSPVQNTLKSSLKKPEDTVKKPTGTAVKKLSFVADPPKSALGLMAAALNKVSKPNKTSSKGDEAEMRQLVKTLSSAQRAAFLKMLTSTLPSRRKQSRRIGNNSFIPVLTRMAIGGLPSKRQGRLGRPKSHRLPSTFHSPLHLLPCPLHHLLPRPLHHLLPRSLAFSLALSLAFSTTFSLAFSLAFSLSYSFSYPTPFPHVYLTQ